MGEYTEAAAQKAALKINNEAGLGSAPGAGQSHYGGEAIRQMALSHSEQGNVARAATESGVTTEVWQAKRKELGRSPTQRDFTEN